MSRTSLAAALVVAFASAAPAAAETTRSEPIATAATQAAPVADETDAQIRQWIAGAPQVNLDDGEVDGVVENGPRQVHGEVGVAIGTGGYRSVYAVSAFPVGKTGTLTVAIGETRNGGFGGPGYGYGRGTRQSLGLSFDMTGADREEATCRRRSGGLDGAEPLPPMGWGVRQGCRVER